MFVLPQADVMEGRVPCCPVCTGIVKPDIVFFGELLPQRFMLHVVDFPMADLLLILGTSLEVRQQTWWRTECVGRRLAAGAAEVGAGGVGPRCSGGELKVRVPAKETLPVSHGPCVTGEEKPAVMGVKDSSQMF